MSSAKPTAVKAVAMTAPGIREMRSYPYPQGDRDSAVLRVAMTGVCGTDKHILKGEAIQIPGRPIFPYMGGREVILQQAARYPFASQISHRLSLDELVAQMGVVTNPNECVKVEVVPHPG